LNEKPQTEIVALTERGAIGTMFALQGPIGAARSRNAEKRLTPGVPDIDVFHSLSQRRASGGRGLGKEKTLSMENKVNEMLKRRDEADIDTVLAEDIDFSGVLSFKEPLMIKGKFKGEIKASGDLYIGEKAEVEAKIEARTISSRGRIKGNVVAQSRIELSSTAVVEGDIQCPDLVIESGAVYNGTCLMTKKREEKA
jgi:cytoskeletal protein CcmA (bactofilin family)